MITDETALLRTIRDTPEDDTVRLAYADFLEEEGDVARGEFIRTQIALSRLPADDPLRAALEAHENELLAEHERLWLRIPDNIEGLTAWRFERGFVSEVTATPLFMLGPGSDLCRVHPVSQWRVIGSQENLPPDLLEAGRQRWFRRLEGLNLGGWYQTIGELERFLTRSEFERLRELDLTTLEGLNDLPELLGRSPLCRSLRILRCGHSPYEAGLLDVRECTRSLAPARLTELSLLGCQLNAENLRELLGADCCRELTSLDVRDNPIEPDGWDAFQAAKCRLRKLDLSGTPLGGISLAEVLRWDSTGDLRVLQLNRCGSAMANVQALAASRFWAQAEELHLRSGTIPERALEPLFSSAGPPGLRTLDVAENYFRDVGVAGLCGTAWAGSLLSLGLAQNYLTDGAAHTIASSGRFTHLRTLNLSLNNTYQDEAEPQERLTDVGIRALAESPSLANVRVLALGGTDVTAGGVEALINGAHWRLVGLGLGACRVDEDAIRVLAASPRLAAFTQLDLTSHHGTLDGDVLQPLAESEYLSPLTELNVRGCLLDPLVRAALRQRLGPRLRE